MENKVKISRVQQVTSADLNAMGDFPEAAIDNVVREGVDPGLKFSGFQATAQVGLGGASVVTIAPGALYNGGKVYRLADPVQIDFISLLPVTANKIAQVTVFGSTQETATEPRTFLLDATAGTSEARATSTRIVRVANVDKLDGGESTSPVPAPLPANILAVAYVLLSPTGIVGLTRAVDNVLPSARENADKIADIAGWRKLIGARVDTIQTDLYGLAKELRGTATVDQIGELGRDVAVLKQRAGLPDNFSSYGFDPLLALAQSDTDDVSVTGTPTNPLIVCQVQEGIRFAPIQSQLAQMELLNANDSSVIRADNMVTPAYTEVVRVSSVGNDDRISLAQYENQTVSWSQKQVSADRTRLGTPFTECTNSAFWRSGQYDPISGIFTRNGQSFLVGVDLENSNDVGFNVNHVYVRLQQFWTDTDTDNYWAANVVNSSVNGAMVAQTFLNAQESLISSVGLYFATKGGANITMLLAGCLPDGSPDLKGVIASATITPAMIAGLYPAETRVPIIPTLIERGKRYALIFITTGAHYLSMTVGNKYAQGSLFTSTDGAFFQGDLTKDIAFQLYACTFAAPRCEVQLQPLTLQGGIASIDILNDTIVPSGCAITYAVKLNNVWQAFNSATAAALVGLPALLQFKAVLTGTTDLMPRLGLASRSQVITSRPRTDFTHVTDAFTPPLPAKTIQVDVRLEAWDAAHHGVTCQILSGTGFGTVLNPASYSDTIPPGNPDETIIRRFIFTSAGGLPTFKIKIAGTTDAATNTWHVAYRQHVTFAT